jgi:hypothetical protein
MPENTLFTHLSEEDEATLCNPVHSIWNLDHIVTIDRFWTGSPAIEQKGYGWTNLTQVSSLWNERAVFVHFKCWHSWEALRGSELESATLLIKPAGCQDYFEVSVNSLGELSATHVIQPLLEVDPHWDSGVKAWVLLSETERIWRAILRLPYGPLFRNSNLISAPEIGDAWRLNLRRTAGPEQEREFLSWRPSQTTMSDFFVFGHWIFLGAI